MAPLEQMNQVLEVFVRNDGTLLNKAAKKSRPPK